MSRVIEYLENLPWTGKMVQKAGAGMKAGAVWDYPLRLTKDVDYQIKTKGGRNVRSMTCYLTGDCASLSLCKETGPHPWFSFTPETDGIYWLHLSIDSTRDRAPGAVEVTLLRERVRSSDGRSGFSEPAVAR